MKLLKSISFKKAAGGVAGLIVLLVILIAANVILSNLRLRADLTEDRLYTLSDGTRAFLKKMDRTVTLKLFFSSSSTAIPTYLKTYARQVEDLLNEYRLASKGKLNIEVYDPEPDSDAEEWAQRYGVSPQNMAMFGPPVYFGIVAVSGNTEGVLPVIDPRNEHLLEYHMTRLVYRVLHPEKPVIGVLSSLPVLGTGKPQFGMPPDQEPKKPWLALQELQNDYELRSIEESATEIPSDIRALIVLHPKDLSEDTLYAIDQFVLRGGHLLAFVDPLNVADVESSPPNPYGMPRAASTLGKLFSAWGLGYDPGRVLADMRAVSRLRGSRNEVDESPVFLSLRADNMNSDDILTAQLQSVMLPFAGALEDNTQADLTFTPLIESSDLAGLVATMTAQFGSAAIRRDFTPAAKRLTVAARLTGKFPTAFPDGKPKKPDDAEPADDENTPDIDDAAPALTEGESTVIVVADADLVYDRFSVEEMNFFGARALRPLNDNVTLFGNILEQITGSSDLIRIRSRGVSSRPFTRVLALEETARKEWQEKEKDLEEKLQEARGKLRELEQEKDQSQRFILSSQQKEAIERFRQEEFRINRELKDVRKNLRRDIERLGVQVKVANIALVPLLVGLGGIGFAFHRKHKRARAEQSRET